MQMFVSDSESHAFYKRGGATQRQDRKQIVAGGRYSACVGELSEEVRLQLCELLSCILRSCIHLNVLGKHLWAKHLTYPSESGLLLLRGWGTCLRVELQKIADHVGGGTSDQAHCFPSMIRPESSNTFIFFVARKDLTSLATVVFSLKP